MAIGLFFQFLIISFIAFNVLLLTKLFPVEKSKRRVKAKKA